MNPNLKNVVNIFIIRATIIITGSYYNIFPANSKLEVER